MNKSTNYGMNLPQGNNIVDIDVLNANINVIDNGLSPFYVAVVNSANVYKVITGANKTTLANGYGIRVAIPTPSDGAVSIIIDSCSAVPVKKPNNNAVKNFKQNGVYSLTYYNSVFILASGGVDDVNFSASDLLSGKTANNSDGEKVNGTMPNIGQQTATINAGGKVVISKGYHNGTGYVQANTMAKQMQDLGSTLTSANQLVSGVKAVDKNGNLITGTATIESLGGNIVKYGTFTSTYIPTSKGITPNGYSDYYRKNDTKSYYKISINTGLSTVKKIIYYNLFFGFVLYDVENNNLIYTNDGDSKGAVYHVTASNVAGISCSGGIVNMFATWRSDNQYWIAIGN